MVQKSAVGDLPVQRDVMRHAKRQYQPFGFAVFRQQSDPLL
ncbi:hypothetical protein COLO4_02386 [Corchorus olitorius]|uniref:Uncharacterized protein n=1 Tax=Corchorus olitorius TaxID=93759 RepID=A0A1R3L152_9ROSI|nr:hypothetical protein COLO4_02386 [Corchorus olitorius]